MLDDVLEMREKELNISKEWNAGEDEESEQPEQGQIKKEDEPCMLKTKVAVQNKLPEAKEKADADDRDWKSVQHYVLRKIRQTLTFVDGSLSEVDINAAFSKSFAVGMVPPRSTEALRADLSEQKLTKFKGRVHIIYDVWCAGQTDSRPEHRTCPSRKEHHKRCLDLVLRARGKVKFGEASGLHQADVYMFLDGGRTRLLMA